MDENERVEMERAYGAGAGVWFCIALAALLLACVCVMTCVAGATIWALRSHDGHIGQSSRAIVVSAPTRLTGPAIDLSLPAGSTFSSAQVDDEGGNWWFEKADQHHIRVLIATSRLDGEVPEITQGYLKQVIGVVEHSANERLLRINQVDDKRIGSYPGERADYDVYTSDGGTQHAEALLLRRERDDLLIVLYGDRAESDEIKHAAEQIFDTLNVYPTPDEYNAHDA